MIEKHQELDKFHKILKTSENEKEKKKAREGLKALDSERKNKINKVITQNPDLFVSTFLKATLDIEVPDPPVREDGAVDSAWQYH